MKNIKLVSEQDRIIQDIHSRLEDDRGVTATALVPHDVSDRVFVALVEHPVGCSPGVSARIPVDGLRAGSLDDGCRVIVASILSNGTVEWRVDLLDALEPEERPAAAPNALMALDINNDSLTVCLSTGHILSVEIDTQQVSEVGCIEGGVAGIQYGPDGELVALVSGLGQLILMTSGWEVLMEVCAVDVRCDSPQATAMSETDAVLAMAGGTHAEIGRDTGRDGDEFEKEQGRKEWFRQRRGGRGLMAPDVGISWRGDGKYIATCVRCGVDDLSPGRLRIWDVENLSLHAIGEQSPGTLPVLAWQPNGRTLCVANSLSDSQVEEMAMLRLMKQETGGQGQAPEVRHVGAWKRELRRRQEAAAGEAAGPSRVFIYERNGLQHGDFVVPGDGVRIEQMLWSGDSRTLAVVVCEDDSTRSVQIWCRSNWKWYNKWTRTFQASEHVFVSWQEGADGTALTMLTAKQCSWVISSSKLAWDYDVSDYGTVAVVNGWSVLVTPMRQCMIPPPLCALELSCSRPIVCVLFCRTENGREMIGSLLDDGSLAIATCMDQDDWESMLEEDACNEGRGGNAVQSSDQGDFRRQILRPIVYKGTGNRQFRHAAFLGTGQVVFVGQSADGVDSLFHYSFTLPDETSRGDDDGGELRFENCVELEAHVSRLVSFGNSSALLEFEDGRCSAYTIDTVEGRAGTVQGLPGFGSPCNVVRVVSIEICGDTSTHGRHGQYGQGPVEPADACILGLDQATGRLYRNGSLLASDVTSIGVHSRSAGGPHLLYTTRTNVLRTLPLFGDGSSAVNRAIEDGCVLVSLPEGSVDVIMQAPRGNLEVVRPRALVLPAVHSALDRLDYLAAWRLATINRVDMNELVNHGWPKLLDNVEAFFVAVGSDVEVAGFLQSLEAPAAHKGSNPNRLQLVCEAFRRHAAGRRSWLRTELTSHTKCGDIGKALLRVKEIKEIDMSDGDELTPQPSAEVGLKHVLLYNPENAVYEAALGEYELQLSYMVVAHIQRDPGEYLAQLQEFAVIENQYMRQAAIDKHLGRFERAVKNLFEAGSFDDALELATSNGLLKYLLALVDASEGTDANGGENPGCGEHPASFKRPVVLKAMGEHLSSNGKYEDAALAYIAAGDLEQAMRSYRLASAWRPAMTLALRLGKDAAFIRDLARRLCDDLEEFQPVDAARIHLEYLNNIPAAIKLFAQGGEWREALRLAVGTHRPAGAFPAHVAGNVSTGSGNAGNEFDMADTDELMKILVSVASRSAARLLEGFIEDTERVDKYWSRLRDLREKRLAMEKLESDRDHDTSMDLNDDAFVDTASMATDMSMFSLLTDATATSTSTFASFASTVGGRQKVGKRQSKKRNKIRRGSPEEEDQLARFILTLLPKANICEECGQLSEFLVFIGHEDDAIKLQSSLKALIDKASVAAEDVLASPPPGKQMILPYEVREGIFNESGPSTLLKVDRHVASVANAELQLQVQEGKTEMSQTGWKWELLRRV